MPGKGVDSSISRAEPTTIATPTSAAPSAARRVSLGSIGRTRASAAPIPSSQARVWSPKYAKGLLVPVCRHESHSEPPMTTARARAIRRNATGHARSASPVPPTSSRIRSGHTT